MEFLGIYILGFEGIEDTPRQWVNALLSILIKVTKHFNELGRIVRMFKKKEKLEIVVSETEMFSAISHLQSLSFSKASGEPASWTKTRLLNNIAREIGRNPEVGKLYHIAPNLYALVHYFGIDLVGDFDDQRLQVWLLIRPASDPNQLITLNSELNQRVG